MTDVLDAIHEDHANMAQMLNALERQLQVFDAGDTPDYDIVRGVVAYCLDYPDLYHHPKEDLVFERLKAVDPDAAAKVGNLPGEHGELAARTRRLQEAVAAVLGDLEVPRGQFDATLREFLDTYRRHMNEEERGFLPAARRALSAETWPRSRPACAGPTIRYSAPPAKTVSPPCAETSSPGPRTRRRTTKRPSAVATAPGAVVDRRSEF